MIGAAVFLASAIAPAAMSADASRRQFSTYPTWALVQDRSAGTQMEALVETNGKVRWCRVVAFVGSERLANEECERLARRRLTPAIGPNGRPILGLYRSSFLRSLDGNTAEAVAVRAWKTPAEITVRSAQAPDVERIDRVSVTILVKADGTGAECKAPTGTPQVVPEALVASACTEASKLTFERLSSSEGQPADYVTTVSVDFADSSPA